MGKDPNAILAKIRTMLVTLGRNAPAERSWALRELMAGMTDLDRFLSSGGHPPADWDIAFSSRAPRGQQDQSGDDLFRPR